MGVTEANWLPGGEWTGSNTLSVAVDSDSTWTVTGKSTMSQLVIEEGAAIRAADGTVPTMTLDGEATGIAPGTYTGAIVIDL
jgi:hypothetical protein